MMSSPDRTSGRTLGVLIFLHMVTGLIVPFMMLHPLNAPGGFLANAAPAADQVRWAVMMLFVGSALPVAIVCTAWPVFQRVSAGFTLGLLSLAVASFVLQCVDNGHILSMVSLSRAYASADPASQSAFQVAATAMSALRKWSHYPFLLLVGRWLFLLFTFCFRFRLTPRWLAGFGMWAALGQITGVAVWGLWGNPPETRLAMPLAPAYLGLAGWFFWKGVAARPHPAAAAAE